MPVPPEAKLKPLIIEFSKASQKWRNIRTLPIPLNEKHNLKVIACGIIVIRYLIEQKNIRSAMILWILWIYDHDCLFNLRTSLILQVILMTLPLESVYLTILTDVTGSLHIMLLSFYASQLSHSSLKVTTRKLTFNNEILRDELNFVTKKVFL